MSNSQQFLNVLSDLRLELDIPKKSYFGAIASVASYHVSTVYRWFRYNNIPTSNFDFVYETVVEHIDDIVRNAAHQERRRKMQRIQEMWDVVREDYTARLFDVY